MDLQITPILDRLDEVYITHDLLPSHILWVFFMLPRSPRALLSFFVADLPALLLLVLHL